MSPQDLAADLRSRINPAYASQIGTESYERRLCAEAIEAFMARREEGDQLILRLTEERAEAMAQRDELLALVNGFHRKLETYRNVYSGDKELRRLLSECETALAKVKP